MAGMELPVSLFYSDYDNPYCEFIIEDVMTTFLVDTGMPYTSVTLAQVA